MRPVNADGPMLHCGSLCLGAERTSLMKLESPHRRNLLLARQCKQMVVNWDKTAKKPPPLLIVLLQQALPEASRPKEEAQAAVAAAGLLQ